MFSLYFYIMNYKERFCKKSGYKWKQYNSLQKCQCNECIVERKANEKPKKHKVTPKIKPVSDKRKKEDAIYQLERVLFLKQPENRICPITGQPTTEIHHVKKRRGYADEYARLNNISLLLDKRFWLAVSREGHQKIEDNPEWAFEMGYSKRNNSK